MITSTERGKRLVKIFVSEYTKNGKVKDGNIASEIIVGYGLFSDYVANIDSKNKDAAAAKFKEKLEKAAKAYRNKVSSEALLKD